jgi:hypothetical protein
VRGLVIVVCWLASGCVTADAARAGGPPVEGLVRQRQSTCGQRGFVLAVGSEPVAGRRFSVRVGALDGAELASIVTSDDGAFRLEALPAGRYCFVETTDPTATPTACAGTLVFDPVAEPVPVVVLPSKPCR